jgi:hypothetical protein
MDLVSGGRIVGFRSCHQLSHLAGWTFLADDANLDHTARYPSGKGEVCKTFIRRFDSDPRLQPFLVFP